MSKKSKYSTTKDAALDEIARIQQEELGGYETECNPLDRSKTETTRRPLRITQDEADRAATLLLLRRDPAMEHVVKCLQALSAGAIKAIWVDVE